MRKSARRRFENRVEDLIGQANRELRGMLRVGRRITGGTIMIKTELINVPGINTIQALSMDVVHPTNTRQNGMAIGACVAAGMLKSTQGSKYGVVLIRCLGSEIRGVHERHAMETLRDE